MVVIHDTVGKCLRQASSSSNMNAMWFGVYVTINDIRDLGILILLLTLQGLFLALAGLCRLDGIPLVVHWGRRARHVVDHVLGYSGCTTSGGSTSALALRNLKVATNSDTSTTIIPAASTATATSIANSQVFIRAAHSQKKGSVTSWRMNLSTEIRLLSASPPSTIGRTIKLNKAIVYITAIALRYVIVC